MSLIEEYLSPRGVTDSEVIAARGYEEVEAGVKIPLYPVASAAGDGQPYGFEVRLIPPKVTKGPDGREKVQKFARPKGQAQQMSVNPFYFERPAAGKPLWIVEGTTRADALHQRGVTAVVSLTSCWGWKQAGGVDGQLDELDLRGREVWLWFDGDVATKRDVNVAAHRLSAVLESRGAVPRYGIVPDGKGLDDWLAEGHEVSGLRMHLHEELPLVQDEAVSEDTFIQGTGLPRTSDTQLAMAWLRQTSDVCHVNGEWWAHVGGRWIRTPGGTAARTRLLPFMIAMGDAYYEIGEAAGNPRARAFGRKTREILESSQKCSAVLMQGLAVPEAAREMSQFDNDPWVLNLANGTLDLRTRELREWNPADMITGIAPTDYDPNATAPTFIAFLEASLPDPGVRSYLQRMLGATLPGMTLSQRVLVLSGRTRAGKGTLTRALFGVLGDDYSGELRREVIMKNARAGADHQTQVMWLKGRRLANVSETNEGEEFDSARLKALTGGDQITARGMHQDQTTFKPTHNLLMSTNALPNVDSSDVALWGRLRVIPFRESFLGREDETLDHRLQEERSGILNWLLDGLTEYLATGEGEPPADVARAKDEWRDTGDSVAGYAHTLLTGPRPPGGSLSKADMRAGYDAWCVANDMQPLPANSPKFRTGLEAAGFAEVQVAKSVDPKRPRVWVHDTWASVDAEVGNRASTGQDDHWHIASTGHDLQAQGAQGKSQYDSDTSPTLHFDRTRAMIVSPSSDGAVAANRPFALCCHVPAGHAPCTPCAGDQDALCSPVHPAQLDPLTRSADFPGGLPV